MFGASMCYLQTYVDMTFPWCSESETYTSLRIEPGRRIFAIVFGRGVHQSSGVGGLSGPSTSWVTAAARRSGAPCLVTLDQVPCCL